MAYINVDEVYILDNTGLQVDMATDIPFADAGFTDVQKEQARKNIAAGGSNRNLLDNAYFVGGGSQLGEGVFPINQRGLTTYSNSSYGIDRWVGNYTLNAGYLTVNGFMYQIASYPLGVPLTFSAMLADGSVVGGTLTITETTTQEYFYTDGSTIQLVKASGGGALMVWTGSSVNVKAVKLEVGTVSTLANDPPPDFGEELRKCQRRLFIHDFANGDIIASGFAVSATYSVFSLPLPVSMASDGTLTGTVTANPLIYGGGTGEQTSSFSVSAVKGNYAKIGVATTVMPANNSVTLYANTNIRLTISKEL